MRYIFGSGSDGLRACRLVAQCREVARRFGEVIGCQRKSLLAFFLPLSLSLATWYSKRVLYPVGSCMHQVLMGGSVL